MNTTIKGALPMTPVFETVLAKYGWILIGITFGFAAKYALLLKRGVQVKARLVFADLLLLPLVALIAYWMATRAGVEAEAAALFSAFSTVGADRLVKLLTDRFLQRVDAEAAAVAESIASGRSCPRKLLIQLAVPLLDPVWNVALDNVNLNIEALGMPDYIYNYLLKTIEGDALSQAIRRAVRGESVVAQEMTGKLVAAYRGASAALAVPADRPVAAVAPPSRLDVMSRRELDILRGIARGQGNKEIARSLGIAETTVKIHVQHILRKLDVSSRVHAAVIATGHGLA